MTPGGVQEIISYFAGILHLFEDPERGWNHLLYPAQLGLVGEDPAPIGANPGGIPGISDLSASHPTLFPIFDDPASHFPHQGMYHMHVHPVRLLGPQYIYNHPTDHVQVDLPTLNPYSTATETQPPIVPNQENVSVGQINKLVADQLVGLSPDNPSAQADPFHAVSQIQHLVDVAQSLVPDGFQALNDYQTDGQQLTTTTIDPVSLVNSHDAFMASDTTTLVTMPFGEYVNGVYDPNFSTTFPQFDAPTIPGMPVDGTTNTTEINGALNSGVEVIAGSNFQENVAGILDDGNSNSSMIVLGNSFTTNAIFQTNILQDMTSITTAAPDALSSILNGADHLNNFASFINGESLLTSVGGTGTGPVANTSWNLDVVNGNYYDVNVVSQLNVLAAGSISFQTTQDSFFEAITGANQQANQFFLTSNGPTFDLIIVAGNYQNANIIDQTNVLLNDSNIQAILDGGNHGSLSISSGGNTLANEASITSFGHGAESLSAQLAAEAQNALSGFISDIANLAPGMGQLNVLYVTGNFYNINLVAQTNILSDPNIALQLMNGGSEIISTGGNEVINVAQIIDASNLGSQFVAGGQYSDSLMVQANILENVSHVTTADPQALANEVIAFLGHDAPAIVTPASEAPGVATTTHSDPISSVLS